MAQHSLTAFEPAINVALLLCVTAFVAALVWIALRWPVQSDAAPFDVLCLDDESFAAIDAGADVVLGRDAACALTLDDPDVSRRHVALRRIGANVSLSDLGSANGVWMDGRRVFHEALRHGDQFQVGQLVLAVVRRGQLPPERREHRGATGVAASGIRPAPPLSDYDMLDVLHTGSKFVVRRARHRGDRGLVVLKFAHTTMLGAQSRARLARYAHDAMRINHPRCVRLLGGDASAEAPFLIEAFAPGAPLTRWMRDAALSLDGVRSALSDVCAALLWLHTRGLTHGALTPSDVLFGADGRALLANAGLAHALDQPTDAQSPYVAPELARWPHLAHQPSSDAYALAAIAYTLLGGVLPRRAAGGRAKSPPIAPLAGDAPAELAAVIGAMLDPHPDRRVASLDALDMALQAGALEVRGAPIVVGDCADDGVMRPIRLHVISTQCVLPVSSNPFELGRERLNTADRSMSRRHAELTFIDNAWRVCPATLALTVLLNGAPVDGATIVTIGDELRLGATIVRIME